MKPQLLIDAHAPGGSGLGRYTFEMLRGLAARDDFGVIHLAGPLAVMQAWRESLPNAVTPVQVIRWDVGRYSPRIPLLWARVQAAVGAAHVTWFPHWDGAWTAQPAVTTLHDLIFLEGVGAREAVRATIARQWMSRMIRGSHRVLTGTAGSASAIATAFPSAREKLVIIHHGVNAAFYESSGEPAGGSRAPYLLTVANKREHKRLETAIRAFARVAAEQPDLRLVMVGSRDAHAGALRTLADDLGIAHRVDDLEGVDDGRLAALYRGARALLVSSRTEGFGLVILEAMASGTPVIAVDRPPLPEVAGDAAIVVPFDDDAAMAEAIRGLDEPSSRRLADAGRARAAAFTWQRAADAAAAVLLDAFMARGRGTR